MSGIVINIDPVIFQLGGFAMPDAVLIRFRKGLEAALIIVTVPRLLPSRYHKERG